MVKETLLESLIKFFIFYDDSGNASLKLMLSYFLFSAF